MVSDFSHSANCSLAIHVARFPSCAWLSKMPSHTDRHMLHGLTHPRATLGLLPCLSCCERCCREHGVAVRFLWEKNGVLFGFLGGYAPPPPGVSPSCFCRTRHERLMAASSLTGGTGRRQNGDGGAGPQMARELPSPAQPCPAGFLLRVRTHSSLSVRDSVPCSPQHPNRHSVLPRR